MSKLQSKLAAARWARPMERARMGAKAVLNNVFPTERREVLRRAWELRFSQAMTWDKIAHVLNCEERTLGEPWNQRTISDAMEEVGLWTRLVKTHDPAEQPVMDAVYRERSKGQPWPTVAEVLNRAGLTLGRPWTRNMLVRWVEKQTAARTPASVRIRLGWISSRTLAEVLSRTCDLWFKHRDWRKVAATLNKEGVILPEIGTWTAESVAEEVAKARLFDTFTES